MGYESNQGNLLLIAAREPMAGVSKTRLGSTIGMERAAMLYRAFLTDVADRFTLADGWAPNYTVGWAFSPPECDFAAVLKRLSSRAFPANALFVPQDGIDWGERQTNLLRWGASHGFARTVLTASDSPQMTRRSIDEAFESLERSDVVLGRVHDGGYYLIGVRGFHDVLTGVPMSTINAAESLVERAVSMGLSVAELAPTFDVDTHADLDLLLELLEADPSAAPATARALALLGLQRAGAAVHSPPAARSGM